MWRFIIVNVHTGKIEVSDSGDFAEERRKNSDYAVIDTLVGRVLTRDVQSEVPVLYGNEVKREEDTDSVAVEVNSLYSRALDWAVHQTLLYERLEVYASGPIPKYSSLEEVGDGQLLYMPIINKYHLCIRLVNHVFVVCDDVNWHVMTGPDALTTVLRWYVAYGVGHEETTLVKVPKEFVYE